LGAINSCQSTAIIWQSAAHAIGHFAEVPPKKPRENPTTAASRARNGTEVHVLMIRKHTTMLAIDAPFSTTYGVFIVAITFYVLHNSGVS
jgi:hypothetical protein